MTKPPVWLLVAYAAIALFAWGLAAYKPNVISIGSAVVLTLLAVSGARGRPLR
jgi:hypothetical protein